ncbi:uncharacterized membrane protein YraQ (UPF0718 family) [Evansella vedderi]|uniref:Uncharacterized membrane protein YraQ (UPF0718 family) n=1 Tax=Evansella vedderi TaxID=38282 RepID=A0ABT9ZWI9_9BACI|nr:PrgI family protein [Evansella vedderi]MDQ0255587.1 uncharacterized membrane protein YraQ (UPF0718 family) [Evansella vedderi]
MNEIVVPIDITAEEKEVLAIFSMRQFLLTVPTLAACVVFLVWFSIPFVSGWTDFIIRLIIALVVAGTAIALAFVKLNKYEQYLSEFVITQWSYHRGQKTFHQ